MKKILIILTIIAVFAVLASLLLNYLSSGLNRESRDFADRIIPSIVRSWNPEILIKNASPELLKKVPAYKIRNSFSAFSSRFGSLEKYHGSTGQVGIHFEKNKRIITATYSAKASFANRPATIKIQLIRHDDGWLISAFHID